MKKIDEYEGYFTDLTKTQKEDLFCMTDAAERILTEQYKSKVKDPDSFREPEVPSNIKHAISVTAQRNAERFIFGTSSANEKGVKEEEQAETLLEKYGISPNKTFFQMPPVKNLHGQLVTRYDPFTPTFKSTMNKVLSMLKTQNSKSKQQLEDYDKNKIMDYSLNESDVYYNKLAQNAVKGGVGNWTFPIGDGR